MKILQITPADDWYAHYVLDKGRQCEVKDVYFKIVCWALTQNGEKTEILGMVENGREIEPAYIVAVKNKDLHFSGYTDEPKQLSYS